MQAYPSSKPKVAADLRASIPTNAWPLGDRPLPKFENASMRSNNNTYESIPLPALQLLQKRLAHKTHGIFQIGVSRFEIGVPEFHSRPSVNALRDIVDILN